MIKRFKRLYNIYALGDGIFHRLRLLWWLVGFFMYRSTNVSLSLPQHIQMRFGGKTFLFSPAGHEDIYVLIDLYIEREYDISLKESPNIIFDIGSNTGLSIIYFKLMYPDACVYGFEANPDIFPALQKNCEQFGETVILHNKALSDSNGTATFYIPKRQNASGSLVQRKEGKEVIVQTKTLESMCEELEISHIDLLKFDIEGGEEGLINSTVILKRASHVIGEVHPDLMKDTVETFLERFSDFNIDKKMRSRGRFILEAHRRLI